MPAPHDCSTCPRLVESRNMVVNGYGPQPADVMVIAQNPGAQEEREDVGRPLYELAFSGRKLRTKLMPRAGIDPAAVRFENVVRCRPPRQPNHRGDDAPTPTEIANCRTYLLEEIERTAPRLIITLGAPALKWFFLQYKLDHVHGRPLDWYNTETGGTIMVVPMYHPAAAAPGRNAGLVQVMHNDWDRLGLDTATALGTYREVSGPFMAELLNGVKEFAFDFETAEGSTDWRGTFQARRAIPIGYSIATRGGRAFYTQDSVSYIRGPLEDSDVGVIAHNAKFEWVVAKEQGIDITNLHCTKVEAMVLRYPATDLKSLSRFVLGVEQTRYEDVDWNDPKSFVPYGAADSDLTFQLHEIFVRELREKNLQRVVDIERPLIPIIGAMERKGIRLDREPLDTLRVELEAELEGIQRRLDDSFPAEPPINWNSGQQIARILHGPLDLTVEPTAVLKGRGTEHVGAQTRIRYWPAGLDLEPAAYTDTHLPKTDMNTLRSYDHPITELLVKRSSIVQCIENNLTALPNLIQEDGRIHPSFHQAGDWEEKASNRAGPEKEAPITGRLSCSGPNLMQITHHGDSERPYVAEWGHRIRQGLVASDADHVLVKVDIGQEEPRIGAFLSGCALLLERLESGDIYTPVASKVFGRNITKADVEERQIGKRCFMAWLNRAGAPGIQRSAYWLSDEAAWAVIIDLRDTYPEVEIWWEVLKGQVREQGYVETYFGRPIPRPGIWTGSEEQRNGVYRAIVPDCIQGTAADVLKLGTPRVVDPLPEGAAMVLSVHDELVVDTHRDVQQAVIDLCARMTEGILPINLPAEVSVGPNWADMERVV